MYLVTAATEFEMEPFRSSCATGGVAELITGIGPLETAVRLYGWLSGNEGLVSGVLSFGIGGAYPRCEGGKTIRLLDICLAEQEVLGDLGICLEDRIERFTGRKLRPPDRFTMDVGLLGTAADILRNQGIQFTTGTFVTVSCASGTARRGAMLARQFDGLCENMEGAAVARVCREFGLPCLEIRCISNMVEDRDRRRWRIPEACSKAGATAAMIVTHLLDALHPAQDPRT